jgi:isopenicillin N synthase-like dioxygenase
VLEELYRALKPEGILSVSDHHLKREKILSEITNRSLFKLQRENKKTYSFLKVQD